MDAGITFAELLDYTEDETRRWKQWFAEHPEALDRPCDIAKAGTVRQLLLHVFATEAHFAAAVSDLPRIDRTNLPSSTLDELFGVHDDACRGFREFFSRAQARDWNEIKDLGFRDLKASKRKMVAQALLHGVHHRAQLAVFLRQEGFEGLWIHDLILSKVMP
jgi:uncharacterized damage-inducible protein DinB